MVEDLRLKMCEIGERAYARGLVCGAEGNISAKLPDGNILCTPSGVCKGRMHAEQLAIVDVQGAQIAGSVRASSEIQLHVAIYAASPHVAAIVHTHAPFATTLAVLGETLPRGVLPEVEVFLGDVPLVPYATPGTAALGEAVASWVRRTRAAILQNHGAVTWSMDLESAFLLTETLESACRVFVTARQIGQVRPLSAAAIRSLRGGQM